MNTEGKRIAVVLDDDLDMGRYFPNVIGEWFSVIPLETADFALRYVRQQEKVAVLFCDGRLQADGDTLPVIKEYTKRGIVVVGMSGRAENETAMRQAGCQYFLLKPFGYGDLEKILKMIL